MPPVVPTKGSTSMETSKPFILKPSRLPRPTKNSALGRSLPCSRLKLQQTKAALAAALGECDELKKKSNASSAVGLSSLSLISQDYIQLSIGIESRVQTIRMLEQKLTDAEQERKMSENQAETHKNDIFQLQDEVNMLRAQLDNTERKLKITEHDVQHKMLLSKQLEDELTQVRADNRSLREEVGTLYGVKNALGFCICILALKLFFSL